MLKLVGLISATITRREFVPKSSAAFNMFPSLSDYQRFTRGILSQDDNSIKELYFYVIDLL